MIARLERRIVAHAREPWIRADLDVIPNPDSDDAPIRALVLAILTVGGGS